MFKLFCFLCFIYVSLQGVSTCYGAATSVLETQGCDGERICQASCNNLELKCTTNNKKISRGSFKELKGVKYFVPPFPIEIKVAGIDDAYDIACVTHSTAKATLLKILDNVRKQAHHNLTVIINKKPKIKKLILKKLKKYKKTDKKDIEKLKKHIRPHGKHNHDAYKQITKESLVAKGEPFGELEGRVDDKTDGQILFLRNLISLMDPSNQFVDFWAKLREFCKMRVQGKLPNQRVFQAFFAFPFGNKTEDALNEISKTTNLLDRLGIKSQVLNDTVSNKPGTVEKVGTGNIYENYFENIFSEYLGTGGAQILDHDHNGDGSHHHDHHDNQDNQDNQNNQNNQDNQDDPGHKDREHKDDGKDKGHKDGKEKDQVNQQVSDDSQLTNAQQQDGQSVAELIGYLADWATSHLNERCPCSHVQTVLTKGIAPDGSTHPEIPKKYNVGQIESKTQPDLSVGLINKRTQICSAAYPKICKPRAPGDDLDISDDGLLGAITNGQIPPCSGQAAHLPRCRNARVKRVSKPSTSTSTKTSTTTTKVQEVEGLGHFVEPAY